MTRELLPKPTGAVFVLAALGLGCAPGMMGPGARDASTIEDDAEARELATRLIARVISLEVVHKRPKETAATIRKIVAELDGFVLASVEKGKNRSRLTVRVPSEHTETARSRFRGLGKTVHEEVHGEDSTEAVRDLRIRLENARKTRESYVELLTRATNVDEMLAVEKELERVTVEIESMQAELDALESGVRLATFAVTVRRPIRPGPVGWVFYGTFHAVKWLFVWN